MNNELRKTIADFGKRLQNYQELPNRKCVYDRTDVTYMQMGFCRLVSELERLLEREQSETNGLEVSK